MAEQSFESHVHRPQLTVAGYAVVSFALVCFALRWFGIGGRVTMALGLAGVLGGEIVLLLISRSYTTRLQDRLIKSEIRFRCAPLLTPEQQRMLASLSNKQIAALRFASDAELPALLERAVRERLAPIDIKRAVKNWVPDWDRT